MYSVYIIFSASAQRHYIGHAENITLRLAQHNAGKVRSTKSYCPWDLVFCEYFNTREEAIKRERQIKSFKGGQAFKKLLEK